MWQVKAACLLGALTVITFTNAIPPWNHPVCYDANGAIDISNKKNYPVTLHKFRNPTKIQKLRGRVASSASGQQPFWEIKFKMPATVRGISVIGHQRSNFYGIRLQLLNKTKGILVAINSFIRNRNLSYGLLHVENVHFVRIEKVAGTALSFADIKLNGTQAPEGTSCASNVQTLSNGCYYFFYLHDSIVVNYSCNKRGFHLQGNETVWPCSQNTGGSLKCQKVQPRCKAPPTVLHSFLSVEKREYYENETVPYDCKLGYYLDGPNQLTCTRTGKWTPTQRPRCLENLQCPTPDVPLNGGKTGTNYRVNSRVTFHCQAGYRLIGPQEIQCNSSKQWHPNPEVMCEAIACRSVSRSAVPNGIVRLRTVSQTGYIYGNYLDIVCNKGYKVLGKNIVTCNASGFWDSNLPTCSPIVSSGPCSERQPCRAGKECVVTRQGKAKCVCSASLGKGCLSHYMPMCTSDKITFWSDCDIKNFTCLNPQRQISIVRMSPCDEGPVSKVTVNTNGAKSRYVYKCSLQKKIGPCKGLSKRYYFDQDHNRCLQYDWGGCSPNGNNFESLQQCQKDCRDFQTCNRSERHKTSLGINLAKNRPAYPSNSLSASFVDGSRIYFEEEEEISKWNVSLQWQATINKIVVWNSDYHLPWLNIVLYDGESVILSTRIEREGQCRYDWTLPRSTMATSVGLETGVSSGLHVDEVEVIGNITSRGEMLKWHDIGATAKQYPEIRYSKKQTSTSAENAINGQSRGENYLKCSSTLFSREQKGTFHWLQVDLKRAYFITEIELFLRDGQFRRKWQKGLTVHVKNSDITNLRSAASTLLDLADRCGQPYTSFQDQTSVFPCYFGHTSRFVLLTLIPQYHNAGLQVCEIKVFAVTCNDLTAIDHVRADPESRFAPAEASYSCEDGYHPMSSPSLRCDRTGKWLTQNHTEPYCEHTQSTSIPF